MHLLLVAINAKYIHSNPAVHGLKAYARGYEEHIQIAEYTINHYVEDVIRDVFERRPDAVFFSCYIWNYRMVREVVETLHQIRPELPIWLGGPEVTYDAMQILKELPFLTGIMVGEGEETFLNLVAYYVDGRFHLEDIQGIARLNHVFHPRELIAFENLPFFYEDLGIFENRIIYYESMRGCPYRCSYCLSSIDKTMRTKNIELIKKELQFFLDHKVPQVKFIDRTFNCLHDHAMAIWEYILIHDNGVTNFHFEIAATILNDQEIEILSKMRPGLVQLEIGVQTTNPLTLEAINRIMDLNKLKNIVSRIQEGKNVHQHLDLIAGLPFEDLASFQKSFNDVYAMHPNQLQLGFLKVLKGTKMHGNKGEYGLVYSKEPPYEILSTRWISYEDLLELKMIEQMVEIFYNSDQFNYTIAELEKCFETPYELYYSMGKFFREKEFFAKASSRTYRYQTLLEYAFEIDGEHRDKYKETLTHDLYLRENLKKRPEFAFEHQTEEEKQIIHLFYQEQAEIHTILKKYENYNARQMERMTHVEKYIYLFEKPTILLYDYLEKNPLNQEATIYQISEWVEQKER